MNQNLASKRALVTGGSRGIGAAIVNRLARDGADVALTFVTRRDQANAAATAAHTFGVRAVAIEADATDPTAVVAAVERTVAELGGIDILVNNAGIAAIAPIDSFRIEGFDRIVAVNLRAVFVATQAAVKHMKAGGRVIMIGGCNADRMPFGGGSVYAMSKAAHCGTRERISPRSRPAGYLSEQCSAGADGDRDEPGEQRLRREPTKTHGAAALRYAG